MPILDTTINFSRSVINLLTPKSERFTDNCDNCKNSNNINNSYYNNQYNGISTNMLYIILISNIIFAYVYIWFSYVYINDINPKITVEYQTLFLVLVYFLLIDNSISLLNNIFMLFLV